MNETVKFESNFNFRGNNFSAVPLFCQLCNVGVLFSL